MLEYLTYLLVVLLKINLREVLIMKVKITCSYKNCNECMNCNYKDCLLLTDKEKELIHKEILLLKGINSKKIFSYV